uniref:Uncharacterized protein n=1 Tax=Zooxanthella nutricula TaxID=1333877 RepID=A0A6U6KC55_9DINO|mmetsp:Transcript_27011/g.81482  ORF Transcript_27011/g.81482 Transcript_27011/m.81482 type:complete len:324 (+) Transcript_27011:444-1415(+)
MLMRGQGPDMSMGWQDWCTYVQEEEDCENWHRSQDDQVDHGYRSVTTDTDESDDEGKFTCKHVKAKKSGENPTLEPQKCFQDAWKITPQAISEYEGEMGQTFRKRVLDGKIKMVHLEPKAQLIFVHGGLTLETLKIVESAENPNAVEAINNRVIQLFGAESGLTTSVTESLISEEHPDGPAWTRFAANQKMWLAQWQKVVKRRKKSDVRVDGGNSSEERPEDVPFSYAQRCEEIKEVLKKTQATAMVIGHNRQTDGIAKTACDRHVLLTDTSMSSGFPKGAGKLMALEVVEAHEDHPQEVWAVYPEDADETTCVPFFAMPEDL